MSNGRDIIEGTISIIESVIGFWRWSPEEDIERIKNSKVPKFLKIFLILFFSAIIFVFLGLIAQFGIVLYQYDSKTSGTIVLAIEGLFLATLIWKFLKIIIYKNKKYDEEAIPSYNTDQLVEMEQRRLYEIKYRKEHKIRRILSILVFLVLFIVTFVGSRVLIKKIMDRFEEKNKLKTEDQESDKILQATEIPKKEIIPLVSANENYIVYTMDEMEYNENLLEVDPNVVSYMGYHSICLYFKVKPKRDDVKSTIIVYGYDNKGGFRDRQDVLLDGICTGRENVITVHMNIGSNEAGTGYKVVFSSKKIDEPDGERRIVSQREENGHIYITLEGEKHLDKNVYAYLYKNGELTGILEGRNDEAGESGSTVVDIEVGNADYDSYEVYQ